MKMRAKPTRVLPWPRSLVLYATKSVGMYVCLCMYVFPHRMTVACASSLQPAARLVHTTLTLRSMAKTWTERVLIQASRYLQEGVFQLLRFAFMIPKLTGGELCRFAG
jgi:hypothetical protein